ncbi:MAG: hypothetical protein ACUVR0_00805 [Candidatus Aminicenantales bacterium]
MIGSKIGLFLMGHVFLQEVILDYLEIAKKKPFERIFQGNFEVGDQLAF